MEPFDGTRIPGPLNITTLLDRSLWVFRNRSYAYLMITLVTYGSMMVGIALLYYSGKLRYEEFEGLHGYFLINSDVLLYITFVIVPSLIADLALQQYTSALVRNQEITWGKAVGKAFSADIFNYLLCRIVGVTMLMLVAGIGFFLVFIPVVGGMAYLMFIVMIYTFFSGLVPAVIVEERKVFFSAIGRSMSIATTQFWVMVFSAFLGLLIVLGLMLAGLFFILIVGSVIASLLEGHSTLFMQRDDFERFLFNLSLFFMPLLMAVFYTPLQSIFFSVMYYGFRSKGDAFHLENRLNDAYRRAKAEYEKTEPEKKAGEGEEEAPLEV